mmetsp:Transcript_76928/g.223389  ORF Transcript_76928/g.223389 Transcript_76928/m.223389 type:complete len:471 (+) Transcript_76928:55-1467(+)
MYAALAGAIGPCAAAAALLGLAGLLAAMVLLRRRARHVKPPRPVKPLPPRPPVTRSPPPPATASSARRRWRDCCCGGGGSYGDEAPLVQADVAPPPPSAEPGFSRMVSDVEDAPGLRWPSPEEQEKAKELVAALGAHEREIFLRQPPDIQHMVLLTRFLRGHGCVQAAAKAFAKFLAFRESNADLIRRIRASIPADIQTFDHRLLWSQSTKPWKYVECFPTGLHSGLPMSFIPLSTLSVKGWMNWRKQEMVEFMVSAAEMNCMLLHNLSLRDHRMAKTVEVRDAAGFPLTGGSFLHILGPFRHIMPIAGLYPELCHRLVLFNASPAVLRFISWLRAAEQRLLKRVRREEKLRLIAQDDWEQVTKILTARCVHQLAAATAADSDVTAPGHVVYRSAWLKRGECAAWQCSAGDAADLKALFLPAAGGVQRLANGDMDISGEYMARSEGALLLVGANWAAQQDDICISLQIHV